MRDEISYGQMFTMASRILLLVVALAVPAGFASQAGSITPSLIEDSASRGGGVGFVLLVSLQRNG